MTNRRRTIAAALALTAAVVLYDPPTPLVAIDPNLDSPAPALAQAALDLGPIGTVAITWTIDFLR